MPSGTLRNLNDEINTRILVKTDTTGESAWIHLFFLSHSRAFLEGIRCPGRDKGLMPSEGNAGNFLNPRI